MSKLFRRREFLTTAAAALAAGELAARAARGQGDRPRVKVGQIGVGHDHAAGKMLALRKLADDFEVVGIAEPDPQRRAAAERQAAYRGLDWMSEEQLLAAPGLQAVAVETRVADLVPTAARCVAAGMHLHLDKPAGASLGEFKALLAAADSHGLTVQMGYMFRNNPAFQLCFLAAREGWLGRVFEIHGTMSKQVAAADRKPLADFSGGGMFELGCHLIDALVGVLGRTDKVAPYVERGPDGLADNQLAVMEYPGAIATIRVSLLEVAGTERRQFVVCGDEGTLEIKPLEPPAVRLSLSEPRDRFGRGSQTVDLPVATGRYDEQLLELAAIIRGEREHPYPAEHDLAVEEMLLRASGMPVE